MLISVTETRGHDRMLIATHDGQAVCFDETDVRAKMCIRDRWRKYAPTPTTW